MQVLTDSDYKLLKSVVGLKQESLRKTLKSYLEVKYDLYLEEEIISLIDNSSNKSLHIQQ